MSRLVSVTEQIKLHPLWAGSMEELAFNFGGITEAHVRKMIEDKLNCDDLTPNEQSWIKLWQAQLS